MPKIIKENFLKRIYHGCGVNLIPGYIRAARDNIRHSGIISKLSKSDLVFPKSINLCASAVCQARCIFCPDGRGVKIEPKFMPFELAKKVIDEAKEENFKGTIRFGENGEALLNRDFVRIFAYAREKLPENYAMLVSNIGMLSEGISGEILKNGLNFLHCNIDGARAETYEYVKRGLSFERVKANLLKFIEIRDRLRSKCRIGIAVLTGKTYMKKIEKKDISLDDDARDVVNFWRPLLRKDDCISIIGEPFMWALRDQLKIKKKTHCQLFDRILTESFIAPNGDMYVCCFDYNAELVFGNVWTKTVKEIWNGEERRRVLDKIHNKRFSEAGPPCEFCI